MRGRTGGCVTKHLRVHTPCRTRAIKAWWVCMYDKIMLHTWCAVIRTPEPFASDERGCVRCRRLVSLALIQPHVCVMSSNYTHPSIRPETPSRGLMYYCMRSNFSFVVKILKRRRRAPPVNVAVNQVWPGWLTFHCSRPRNKAQFAGSAAAPSRSLKVYAIRHISSAQLSARTGKKIGLCVALGARLGVIAAALEVHSKSNAINAPFVDEMLCAEITQLQVVRF